VAKTRGALDAILPQSLDLVLDECKASESAWAREQIEVYVQMPEGRKEFVGYNSASFNYRTSFTRIALDRIAALPDMTTREAFEPHHHPTAPSRKPAATGSGLRPAALEQTLRRQKSNVADNVNLRGSGIATLFGSCISGLEERPPRR
jgi:hypothetical protein